MTRLERLLREVEGHIALANEHMRKADEHAERAAAIVKSVKKAG